MKKTKEHLFLSALKGDSVERPPVWLMRQAGRYLPEYMVLKKKYDFFTRVRTPELVCEITMQPIDIIKPDAAILFSDILVIPQALGQEVQMNPGQGPYLPKTIRTKQDIDKLTDLDAPNNLTYVYDAIEVTKKELNNRVPLIGFAGAPFTILCYMVEGQGSKTFSVAKSFCFANPALAHQLLDKITTATIGYLKNKVRAGADAIQIFDSWSGLLSPHDFKVFAQPYMERISNEIAPLCPVVLFPKGSNYALKDLAQSSASALGIDWTIAPQQARELTQNMITLQGNFDPSKLLGTPESIVKEVKEMIAAFGINKYIANLGHGMMPNIPVDHVKLFVETIQNYNV